MRYGLPYKGSKNGIADWVCENLPNAENFYDLFCGGCAITHCAMLRGKYKTYTINDIADTQELFYDAIMGKYQNETRWISREDFYKLKYKDAYIRYLWSFGNIGKNYLYSREVEPYKKALHYARVFNDFSEFDKMGIDLKSATSKNIIQHEKEIKEKYIKWYCKEVLKSDIETETLRKNLLENIKRNREELRNYLLDGLKKANKRPGEVDKYLGTNGMAGHYFSKSKWEFPTREVYEKLQDFLVLPAPFDEIYGLQELLESLQRLESLQSLQRLQSLERLQRLQSLQSLESLESLEKFQCSYEDVKIKENSVIYCDIPYKGTDEYIGGFDHERFYQWARNQKELVVISEYSMPDDFICIARIEKSQLLNGCGNGKKILEGLFIPKEQEKLYIRKQTYLEQLLIDF